MDAVRRTLSTLFVRRMGSALLLMLAMMDTLLPLVRGMAADTKDYGVVIDAGSSGSRVRIYSWASSQKGLPDFQQIHQHKHKPGISAFSDRLDKLREYIVPFLEEAKQAVPLQKHADTPIYLMATAGKMPPLYANPSKCDHGSSHQKCTLVHLCTSYSM